MVCCQEARFSAHERSKGARFFSTTQQSGREFPLLAPSPTPSPLSSTMLATKDRTAQRPSTVEAQAASRQATCRRDV
jgi:hypothetical protein